MKRSVWLLSAAIVILSLALGALLVFASRPPGHGPTPPPQPTRTLAAPPSAIPPSLSSALPPPVTPTAAPTLETADPFALISQQSLLAYIEELTAIQPSSGWRNSASEGEAEALDLIAHKLGQFEHLPGLELERQSFDVPLGVDLWETRLVLTLDGRSVEVPADGLRGPRDDVTRALRFDSDGSLNDAARNPVTVEGAVVLIRSATELAGLSPSDLHDKVVFLDYAVIDRVKPAGRDAAAAAAAELLAREPAGLVLVTRFSDQDGESHGTFVGDVSILNKVEANRMPPTLYVRLEDLTPAGIGGWEDLARVEAARLVWDADVSSPARSGNLVARLPGRDPSRAMILGAHIDSPNGPGALDDASGSAILLEIARVLNAAGTRPPVDLVLVWFGSEELGLLGSAHFVATHPALLDRTVAMLQIDCLTRPLDGLPAAISLVTQPQPAADGSSPTWPETLAAAATRRGLTVVVETIDTPYSDNSSFARLGLPNADLIYMDEKAMEATGSLHYAAHIHDPYDTIDRVQDVGDVLVQMAWVALISALELP